MDKLSSDKRMPFPNLVCRDPLSETAKSLYKVLSVANRILLERHIEQGIFVYDKSGRPVINPDHAPKTIISTRG